MVLSFRRRRRRLRRLSQPVVVRADQRLKQEGSGEQCPAVSEPVISHPISGGGMPMAPLPHWWPALTRQRGCPGPWVRTHLCP